MGHRPKRLSEEEHEEICDALDFLHHGTRGDYSNAAEILQRIVGYYQSYAEPTEEEMERWTIESDAWLASLPVYDSNHPDTDCNRSECGHAYGRHFDPFEGDRAVGCKYCNCMVFKEKTND